MTENQELAKSISTMIGKLAAYQQSIDELSRNIADMRKSLSDKLCSVVDENDYVYPDNDSQPELIDEKYEK